MPNIFLKHQLRSLDYLEPEIILQLLDIFLVEPGLDKGRRWIDEGKKTTKTYVIEDGWAIRYKILSDGRRQILNFQIPGDLIGYFALLFKTSVYSVGPLTPIRIHSFTAKDAFEAFRESPQLAIALSWLASQAERQLDEQLVRIGRRRSAERMAHLFMELNHRLIRAGNPEPVTRLLPLTQPLLADALGMSHIHTHRTFKELARDGLVSVDRRNIRLQDIGALSLLAGFDATYLEQKPLPPATLMAISS